MKNGDHFMRKIIEVQVPSSSYSAAKIDYIDMEYFEVLSGN